MIELTTFSIFGFGIYLSRRKDRKDLSFYSENKKGLNRKLISRLVILIMVLLVWNVKGDLFKGSFKEGELTVGNQISRFVITKTGDFIGEDLNSNPVLNELISMSKELTNPSN